MQINGDVAERSASGAAISILGDAMNSSHYVLPASENWDALAEDEDPSIRLPEHFTAKVIGHVQHRVGEGPLEDLPHNQVVDVVVAQASMVLSWSSEGQPITVYLARPEFQHYVDTGAIRILR